MQFEKSTAGSKRNHTLAMGDAAETTTIAPRADQDAGGSEFDRLRRRCRAHPIEPVGKVIRDLIPWL